MSAPTDEALVARLDAIRANRPSVGDVDFWEKTAVNAEAKAAVFRDATRLPGLPRIAANACSEARWWYEQDAAEVRRKIEKGAARRGE